MLEMPHNITYSGFSICWSNSSYGPLDIINEQRVLLDTYLIPELQGFAVYTFAFGKLVRLTKEASDAI